MLHYVYEEKKHCCGCGLCADICPQKAIEMKKRDDGFLYPHIDSSKCTSCDACRKACSFDKKSIQSYSEFGAKGSYAFKHSVEIQKVSSSGGFFTALSDYVLKQNGIIYGAVFDKDFSVVHERTDTAVGRDRMRGSKYVQSDISRVFLTIGEDLASGRLVLFTGTPCQCAAVLKKIGKKPENLIVMDLICHGVMSNDYFQQYLKDIKRKASPNITGVNFRDKAYGWQDISVSFEDKEKYHSSKDYFYPTYLTNSLQRESCFNCSLATENRFGDFTVGDYWGIKNHHPNLYDDLGVSLVLVNTERGSQILFDICKDDQLNLTPVAKDEYVQYQPNLKMPTKYGDRAVKIQKYYKKHGYNKTMKRFFDVTLQRRINSLIHRVLKKLHLVK